MKRRASNDTRRKTPLTEPSLQSHERLEDELLFHLELGQFVDEIARPVPRAHLTPRVKIGLWLLRLFILATSIMVIYTVIAQTG